MCKLLRGNQIEVERLGEILSQKSVGILVAAALPEVIGICEIYRHARPLLKPLPVAELSPVVERERLSFHLRDAPELCKRKRREELRIHLGEEKGDQVSAPAVNDGDDAYPLVSTHDGIAFPVSGAAPSLNNRWPLVNASFLGFFSGFLAYFSATPSAVFAFLTPKILLQVRS